MGDACAGHNKDRELNSLLSNWLNFMSVENFGDAPATGSKWHCSI